VRQKLDNNESIENKNIIIKSYRGNYNEPLEAFQKDAGEMEKLNYVPVSQKWAEGSYGCGAFLISVLSTIIIIGLIVFIYILIVKPAGILTVTYELRSGSDQLYSEDSSQANVLAKSNNISARAVKTESNSTFDKMMELKEMFDAGSITEKEFNEKKSKILDQL
jgi:uncharacterized membrane protein